MTFRKVNGDVTPMVRKSLATLHQMEEGLKADLAKISEVISDLGMVFDDLLNAEIIVETNK